MGKIYKQFTEKKIQKALNKKKRFLISLIKNVN